MFRPPAVLLPTRSVCSASYADSAFSRMRWKSLVVDVGEPLSPVFLSLFLSLFLSQELLVADVDCSDETRFLPITFGLIPILAPIMRNRVLSF